MRALLVAILMSPLLCTAADHSISKINSSIRIDAGESVGDVETVNGSIQLGDNVTAADISTVNGSIRIGENTQVNAIETVNGSVEIGAGSKAISLETVNGKLKIATGARVLGQVQAVNGTVSLGKEADISGKVSAVNGRIVMLDARVGGGLCTTHGDIDVGAGSRVEGGILVEKPHFSLFKRNRKKPRIVIGPDTVVRGPLKFEHEVDLYVSTSATIGVVEGATPRMFSGSDPGSAKLDDLKVEK